MSQSATLYRLTEDGFSKINQSDKKFNVLEIEVGHSTYDQTFEGLRFILSKERDIEIEKLVQKIFYPDTFFGSEIDYQNIDFENMPDDFDTDASAIYYNAPDSVAHIALFLNSISTADFSKSFDPEELNKNGVYPNGVWNRKTGDDQAFNEQDITDEFIKLKIFFNAAKIEKEYVVSMIG